MSTLGFVIVFMAGAGLGAVVFGVLVYVSCCIAIAKGLNW